MQSDDQEMRDEERIVLCDDESEMQALGTELASSIGPGFLIGLSGELGAGKSVLARSIIHALGYDGPVKSPTYSLIETYNLEQPANQGIASIAHMDLYRLGDAEELYHLGLGDVLSDHDLVMIEWPEKGAPLLPLPELRIQIDYDTAARRKVRLCFLNQSVTL